MKKIVFSTYDDIKNPYYSGGGAVAIHEVAKRLSKKYDLKIVSWNHSGIENEVIDGVVYQRIGSRFMNPKISMAIFQLILPFVMLGQTFDTWFENFSPPFVSSLLPLFTNKKIFGVVHMLPAEDMVRKYKLKLFNFFQNFTIKTYGNLIVTSNHFKTKISELNTQSKIRVISNGINPSKNKGLHKAKKILFLGRIEVDQKGLDLLVEVFERVCEKYNKGIKLIIAGSGSPHEINKLNQIVDKSKHKKYIKIIGKVTGVQKELLMRNCKVMVVTSRFETYSMSTLESLSYGMPVIAFDIDGLSWSPRSAVLKNSPFDIEVMSDNIVEVFCDTKKYEHMSRAGKKYASMYSWDRISNQYEKIIK